MLIQLRHCIPGTLRLEHGSGACSVRTGCCDIPRNASHQTPKTQLSLNVKKLYMADGYAVKEMLKITKLLQDAKHYASGNHVYLLIRNRMRHRQTFLENCRNSSNAGHWHRTLQKKVPSCMTFYRKSWLSGYSV
jgi:hypothetical protein